MKDKKVQPLEIQPLTDEVIANLSIEELEERLEMQILHMTEAQLCWDCDHQCVGRCDTLTCTPNSPCDSNCGSDCFSDCMPNNPVP
jgi:hypothetical protein